MPNIQSAKKELRKREKRTSHNISTKRAIKEEVKAIDQLIAKNEQAEAKKHIVTLQKKLDKAAKTNVLEPNKVNRMKSRITVRINGITSKPSA